LDTLFIPGVNRERFRLSIVNELLELLQYSQRKNLRRVRAL